MRIRHKPWARPELEASSFFIQDPDCRKNQWLDGYPKKQPFYLELGCGKGGFIAQAAVLNPEVNYLAVDIKYEMLGLAKRNVEKAFASAGRTPDNVLLTAHNIERIDMMLGTEDAVDRIYINFCNPWPRMKHKKRRLTHPRQLMHYRTFLKDGCEIHFKTDDDELFAESLEYFAECGFSVRYLTYDLHQSGYEPNLMTEHEKMFSDEGIKIKFVIVVKTELPPQPVMTDTQTETKPETKTETE